MGGVSVGSLNGPEHEGKLATVAAAMVGVGAVDVWGASERVAERGGPTTICASHAVLT